MTVKELIEELSKADPDLEVQCIGNGWISFPVLKAETTLNLFGQRYMDPVHVFLIEVKTP